MNARPYFSFIEFWGDLLETDRIIDSFFWFGFEFRSRNLFPSTCMINDLDVFYGGCVFPAGLSQQGNHCSFVLDAL